MADPDDGTCHWHVDHLLPLTAVQRVFTAEGAAVECELARAIPGTRVAGFGASDYDCGSHLAVARSTSTLADRLESLYEDPASR